MQKGFLEDKDPEEVFRVTAVIQSLLQTARENNIPVTFTMFPEEKLGEILNELNPQDNEIIIKDDTSAFASEEFTDRTKNAETLLIVGCNLHACIRLTVRDAVTHNMKVIVFDNAVLADTYYPEHNIGTWIEFFWKPSVHVQAYNENLFGTFD